MAKRRSYGTGRIYQRGSIWWIRYSINGQRKDESSGSEHEHKAKSLLKIRLAEAETGVMQMTAKGSNHVRVKHLFDLIRADYRRRKHRSLTDLESRLAATIEPLVGELKASMFGSEQIGAYIDARQAAGAADATINRELAIIRRSFKLATRQQPPLVRVVPHFEMIEVENTRQGFLDYSQYLKLLEVMPSWLKAIYVCGYHLGMRAGELRKLDWSQIDFANNEIRLDGKQTKNRDGRVAPIYGDMRQWLIWQKRRQQQNGFGDIEHVFHWGVKRIGKHLKGWREACIKAGMPDLLFHDLRRSAVRNMERAGIPRKVAMSITGHKTENVYRRYHIVKPADLQSAGASLSALFERDHAELTNQSGNVVAVPFAVPFSGKKGQKGTVRSKLSA